MSLHPAQVLLRPVISEKSYEQITQNKYTSLTASIPIARRRRLQHFFSGRAGAKPPRVGPPDAVNTGGPVPLITIWSGRAASPAR